MLSKVSIVKCPSYHFAGLFPAIKKSLDLIGGIENFVGKTDKVLIKPNLLSAAKPETAIDTHPEFIRAVIRLVKQTGAEIFLGDSPSVWGTPQDVNRVYAETGIKKVAYEEGVLLLAFDQSIIVDGYALTPWIKECNRIISLPKFKTHDLTVLTGALKNLFGLVPGLFKTELHRRALSNYDFSKVLADIYGIVRPTLSIVDGVVSLEGDGPASGGIPRNLGLIIAGSDGVAVDSVLATIMGLRPLDILTTKEAAARGLGVMNLDEIEIVGEDLKEAIVPDYKLPQLSILNRMPKPVLKVGKWLVRFRVQFDKDKCRLCEVCLKACPANAISRRQDKMVVEFNRCVLCACCKEVCPYGAVSIKKSLLARLAGI
ncbi:MAG: DUF362 domain-containing protein [Candidatus Omnitrophota bacterium]